MGLTHKSAGTRGLEYLWTLALESDLLVTNIKMRISLNQRLSAHFILIHAVRVVIQYVVFFFFVCFSGSVINMPRLACQNTISESPFISKFLRSLCL